MEQPTPTPPPPTTANPAPPPSAAYPDSLDSSPHSRNTDSWGEQDATLHLPNNPTATATTTTQLGLTKLRLMCSYGGHIVPRPHDKSLCYVGGDTRIVVVDRHTTLSDLTNRLSKILLRSSSSSSASSLLTSTASATASFTLKYQLPSEDLDSLISVTTDEDLENMIDEYERLNLNSSSQANKSPRLRLFLFPTKPKPESVSSIGSLLENSTKSEDWFLNALNGTTSGLSDSSSVNCLLGLDDDVLVPEKKDVERSVIGKNPKANNSAQDIHSVPDLERTSSFGSASSAPSLASLPPIRVHVDDSQKIGGIEEQFSHISIQQQQQKVQEDGGYIAAPAPVVVAGVGVPLSSTPVAADYTPRILSEDERSEQGSLHGYQNHQLQQQQQQQQQPYQQKQSAGFDLASSDSITSDGRPKPAMVYQDQLVQIQTSNSSNRAGDLNSIPDQNTRIQMQQQQQQQQQIADSGYLMPVSNTQVDQLHPQMHHQQPQFIHTAVPPPQYIQHHPSGVVPMASYYQMYPSHQSQHPHLDQQNFVYYMPARQAPHGYNLQMQQQATGYADVSPAAAATPLSHNQAPPSAYTTSRPAQTAPKNELPAGVYGTTNPGASQYVQVSSNQPQPQLQPQPQSQPQYVGYSQVHHPSQSVANPVSGAGATYGYEFSDPTQGQHVYYAAQPLPPQSSAQFQTAAAESGSFLPTDLSAKQQQQQQQGRTQQP